MLGAGSAGCRRCHTCPSSIKIGERTSHDGEAHENMDFAMESLMDFVGSAAAVRRVRLE